MHFTYLLRVDSKNQYFSEFAPAQQLTRLRPVSKLLLVMPLLLRLTQSGPHNNNLKYHFCCYFFTLRLYFRLVTSSRSSARPAARPSWRPSSSPASSRSRRPSAGSSQSQTRSGSARFSSQSRAPGRGEAPAPPPAPRPPPPPPRGPGALCPRPGVTPHHSRSSTSASGTVWA